MRPDFPGIIHARVINVPVPDARGYKFAMIQLTGFNFSKDRFFLECLNFKTERKPMVVILMLQEILHAKVAILIFYPKRMLVLHFNRINYQQCQELWMDQLVVHVQ